MYILWTEKEHEKWLTKYKKESRWTVLLSENQTGVIPEEDLIDRDHRDHVHVLFNSCWTV